MSLQHMPDTVIVETIVPENEGTEERVVSFTFGEFLAYHAHYGASIGEEDYNERITWLRAEDNEYGRLSAWAAIQLFRKQHPDDPAVKFFKRYAIENELPY